MPRLASELGVMSEAALGCVWGRWGQTSTQEDTLEPVSGPHCLGLSDIVTPGGAGTLCIGAPFAWASERVQVAWQEPEGLH